VDDNITLNVRRFEALCRAIIDAGLNDLEYTVQAATSAIANHGERLARLMREAGFRYVFLGIENILEEDPAVPQSRIQEPRARERAENGERHAQGHRASASQQDDRGRRADRPQPRATPARRSKPILNSPEDTWTGLTSSTRRPTPARR
jgi:hypothetical protein